MGSSRADSQADSGQDAHSTQALPPQDSGLA